ncbi:Eco57I restriction-modification methylase domain-containing protein [Rhodohalobacter sp. 8-1]|uniref:Eco57I restriction-modification methylase domain-containing protein n=1 Tax=Rhodohalobacter sp. 8-1 TaxID=3131972 RepID=UPI0030ECA4FF
MEKSTLETYLSSAYDRKNWIEILEEVFKTGKVFQEPQKADLPKSDNCKEGFQLGTFETADGRKISVFEIEVTDKTQLDRNRVSLRNLLRSYYSQVDGIFAVFKKDDNWRFSFISKVTDYDEEKEEFVEVETEPKRYTYVLGKGEAVKTATDRFISLVESRSVTYEDIKDAFSVERLNKEFYKKVVSFFYDLIGVKEPGRGGEQHPHLLKLPSVSQTSKEGKKTHQEFAVRLIGRTVFCWFLRFKKSEQGNPIIPKEVLSSENIPEDYYHKYLERLFFQVMNTKSDERRDNIPEAFKSIPFLNGGLFEPHLNDYYSADDTDGLSKHFSTLKIPDGWFKDFYKILEQYNFTIDENSVEDADVSVDPEMLGRIFENLLAEIDPASGKTARKATGSYYTPREIVDYMVDESLTKYLSNKTDVNERRLLPLLKFDTEIEIDISEQESTAIIEALNELKVLDPACGSGAFPIGVLQKMVRILEKVDPESEQWKDLQLRKIPSDVIRQIIKKKLDSATVEYARKLGIIQHSIYGVDIQPIAAEISQLRCFLSLIVEEKVNENEDNWAIIPLPNLDFKFITANSLISLPSRESVQIDAFGASDLLERLGTIRDDYLQASGEDKEILKEQFSETQDAIFQKEIKETGKNKDQRAMMLSQWEPFADSVTGWFDPKWMFGVDQFDVVIGNPPYGGDKVSNDLKEELKLGSKDPYGAFIARFLPDGKTPSPLGYQGILTFIVSDTFMTIKTHRELRDMMMDNYIHKMIRVHPDTFKATVNTAIIVCERNEFPVEDKKAVRQFDEAHRCLMGDLTRISIHVQHERFVQLLERTVQYKHALPETGTESAKEEHGVLWMRGPDWSSESSEEYAFYTYPQSMIKTNSNQPFFVGSPKLFALMQDQGEEIETKTVDLNGEEIEAAKVHLNGNEVNVVKLGKIADVNQGLATGDNHSYLYQKPEARGTYRSIFDFEEYLLTEEDLESIRTDDELRLSIIENGISKDDSNSDRYFGGRYIIEYDKGGESDSTEGWMPNYHVPTSYFIDWSEWAIERFNTYKIADRIRDRNENKEIKPHYETTMCAVVRNPDKYFVYGVTYSPTGIYSPTFRLGSGANFGNKGSTIFARISATKLLATLSSRCYRFLLKNFRAHTIESPEQGLMDTTLVTDVSEIDELVDSIIQEQKSDLNYDYASHEQIKINKLVYNAYGLNKHDIREVENWYARRYPRLVAAQKENLRNLGKSDDYLELYEEVGEETN